MTISPDGWGVWQGSVSLMEGRGFRYLFGPPVLDWPPLYPIYLALWQTLFGVSGRTLASANVALSAVAASAWTSIFLYPTSGTATWRRQPTLVRAACAASVALFVATTIVGVYTAVLAHNLFYALLPAAFHATSQSARAKSGHFLCASAVVGAIFCLLLLTHNSALVFAGPVMYLILSNRRHGIWVRSRAVAAAVLAPCAIWYLVRISLHQVGSHKIVGMKSLRDYGWQAVDGVAYFLGLDSGHVVLLAIVALVIVAALSAPPTLRSTTSNYLIMSMGATIALIAVFCRTLIADPLGSRAPVFGIRFLLYWPLTLGGLGICWLFIWKACGTRRAWIKAGRLAGGAALVFAFAVSCLRLHDIRPSNADAAFVRCFEDDFACNQMTLRLGFVDRRPILEEGLVVRSPPHYPWIP